MTFQSLDWRSSALAAHENHLGSFETCWISGHTSDQLSRTSGGGPQVWWSLRVPKWSPYAAMMKPLMYDSGALPSGLLRCFLQTYMNLRELEFRTLRMRSSFGKGHKIWHNLLLPVSKQVCTMWLLWRTGENNSPHLNEAVFSIGQTRSVIMLCFQTKKKVGPWDENERGSLVITYLFCQVPRHLWIPVSGWTNTELSETWLPYKTQGFCKPVIMGQ